MNKQTCSDRMGIQRRGQFVVLFALLIPVIIVIMGFAIDIAHMQRVRTELRSTADLAAKAAADVLSETQDLDQAREAAKYFAGLNTVGGEPLSLLDSDIRFGRSLKQEDGKWSFMAEQMPFNSVQVNAMRTTNSADGGVPLYFGSFYGKTEFQPVMASVATVVDVDICLVLDRSSSMKLKVDSTSGGMSTQNPRFCKKPYADSRWVALDNAVQLFIARLAGGESEQLSVVTFASNYTSNCGETNLAATIDQGLTTDVSLASAAMTARSDAVWNGATEINTGIYKGTSVLTGSAARTYADKIMIVFTDGVYTNQHPRYAATAAANQYIRIHTITFGNGANQTDMQEVANIGGGLHYHAPDAETLEEIFEKIAASIAFLSE